MKYLMEEHLIKEHRKDIQREIDHICLEGYALRGRVFRPNWFTRAMQRLGQWLILQGEGLVKRYETPSKKAGQHSGQSYAH
jgi:hypothetical protein